MPCTAQAAYGLHPKGILFPPLTWAGGAIANETSEGRDTDSNTPQLFVASEVRLKQQCADFVVFEVDSDGVVVGCADSSSSEASSPAERWARYSHPTSAPSVLKQARGVAKAAAAAAAATAATATASSDAKATSSSSNGPLSADQLSGETSAARRAEDGLMSVFEKRGLPLVFDAFSSAAGVGASTATPPPPLPIAAILPCFCERGAVAADEEACDCGMAGLRSAVRRYAFAVLAGYAPLGEAPNSTAVGANEPHQSASEVMALWAKAVLPTEDYEDFLAEYGGGDALVVSVAADHRAALVATVRAGLPVASFNGKVLRSFVRIALRYRYPFLDCHTFATTTAASTAIAGGVPTIECLTLLPNADFFAHAAVFGAPHPNALSGALGDNIDTIDAKAASKALCELTRLTRASLLLTVPPYLMLGVPEGLQGGAIGSSVTFAESSSSSNSGAGVAAADASVSADASAPAVAEEPPKASAASSSSAVAYESNPIDDDLMSFWLGGGGGGGAKKAAAPAPVVAAPPKAPEPTAAVLAAKAPQSSSSDPSATIVYCLAHPLRTSAATTAVTNLASYRTFPPISLDFALSASKDDRGAFHSACRKVYGAAWRKGVASGTLTLSLDRGAVMRLLQSGGGGEKRPREGDDDNATAAGRSHAAPSSSSPQPSPTTDEGVEEVQYTHFVALKANVDLLRMKDTLAEAFTHHGYSLEAPTSSSVVLPSAVTIAGIKDKAAITAQRISVRGDYTTRCRGDASGLLKYALTEDEYAILCSRGGVDGKAAAVGGSSTSRFVGIDWAMRRVVGAAPPAASPFATRAALRALADDLATARENAVRAAAAVIVGIQQQQQSEGGDGDGECVVAAVEHLVASMLADPTVQLVYASGGNTADADGDAEGADSAEATAATREPAWLLLTHASLLSYPLALGDLCGNRFRIVASIAGRSVPATSSSGAVPEAISADVATVRDALTQRQAVMRALAATASGEDSAHAADSHAVSPQAMAFPNHFGTQRFGIINTIAVAGGATSVDEKTPAAPLALSADPIVEAFACRSPQYLATLTKNTGVYMLMGDYSRAVDSLLFFGTLDETEASSTSSSSSAAFSFVIGKLQRYLLLTGNFGQVATSARFPDALSLADAFRRAHGGAEAVRRAIAAFEEAGTESAMLSTPFAPTGSAAAAIQYVKCQRLATTFRDASVIIERLTSAAKGARLGGKLASTVHTEQQHLLPSPFVVTEAALAFRANGPAWAAVCERAINAVPFALRQLWLHAAQSLVFNHALSRAVVAGRLLGGGGGGGDGGLLGPLAAPATVLPLLGRLPLPDSIVSGDAASASLELSGLLVHAAVGRFNSSRGIGIGGSSSVAAEAVVEDGDDNAVAVGDEGASADDAPPSAAGASSVPSVPPPGAAALLSEALVEDIGMPPSVFFYEGAVTAGVSRGGAASATAPSTAPTATAAPSIVETIASQRAQRAAQEVCGVSLLPHARTALAVAKGVTVAVDGAHVSDGTNEKAAGDVVRLSLSFSLPSAAYATVFLMHFLGLVPK